MAFDSTFSNFLRTSKVDETQFAFLFGSLRLEAAINKQDGMASGGGVVIVSWGNFSIFMSESDQFKDLSLIFDLNFDKAIDEDLVVDLFEFEFLGLWGEVLREDEKVHHFLVVNF